MTFLATLNRMAPTAAKRVATLSVKPTAVALTQRRFNSTGTEVRLNTSHFNVPTHINFFYIVDDCS